MKNRLQIKKKLEINSLNVWQYFLYCFLIIASPKLNLLLRKFRIISIILLTIGVISCGQITDTAVKLNLNVSRINKIQTKNKINNQVYLKGTVESNAPFLGTGAYELTDDTGSIWIFSRNKLPNIGEKITVKGKVRYQSIIISGLGNKDVGDFYLEELERMETQNQEDNEK